MAPTHSEERCRIGIGRKLEADRHRPRRDQAQQHALADLVDDAALRRFE
jgi:hypothetical protein